MVPLGTAMTISYRLLIETMFLSAAVWPQFCMQSWFTILPNYHIVSYHWL